MWLERAVGMLCCVWSTLTLCVLPLAISGKMLILTFMGFFFLLFFFLCRRMLSVVPALIPSRSGRPYLFKKL